VLLCFYSLFSCLSYRKTYQYCTSKQFRSQKLQYSDTVLNSTTRVRVVSSTVRYGIWDTVLRTEEYSSTVQYCSRSEAFSDFASAQRRYWCLIFGALQYSSNIGSWLLEVVMNDTRLASMSMGLSQDSSNFLFMFICYHLFINGEAIEDQTTCRSQYSIFVFRTRSRLGTVLEYLQYSELGVFEVNHGAFCIRVFCVRSTEYSYSSSRALGNQPF
jgi:hypothetical protein